MYKHLASRKQSREITRENSPQSPRTDHGSNVYIAMALEKMEGSWRLDKMHQHKTVLHIQRVLTTLSTVFVDDDGIKPCLLPDHEMPLLGLIVRPEKETEVRSIVVVFSILDVIL